MSICYCDLFQYRLLSLLLHQWYLLNFRYYFLLLTLVFFRNLFLLFQILLQIVNTLFYLFLYNLMFLLFCFLMLFLLNLNLLSSDNSWKLLLWRLWGFTWTLVTWLWSLLLRLWWRLLLLERINFLTVCQFRLFWQLLHFFNLLLWRTLFGDFLYFLNLTFFMRLWGSFLSFLSFLLFIFLE